MRHEAPSTRLFVRPQITSLRTLEDCQDMLECLVKISVRQRRRGEVPPLSHAPHVYYQRQPAEYWSSALDTYQAGNGDCDNLSVWLAADFRVRGVPARVVVQRVAPKLWHAMVQFLARRGRLVIADPSRARGMV